MHCWQGTNSGRRYRSSARACAGGPERPGAGLVRPGFIDRTAQITTRKRLVHTEKGKGGEKGKGNPDSRAREKNWIRRTRLDVRWGFLTMREPRVLISRASSRIQQGGNRGVQRTMYRERKALWRTIATSYCRGSEGAPPTEPTSVVSGKPASKQCKRAASVAFPTCPTRDQLCASWWTVGRGTRLDLPAAEFPSPTVPGGQRIS